MKFTNEISDSVAEEHPKQLLIVAEQRIRAMHQHGDGMPVQLHEVGATALFSGPTLESKIKIGSNTNAKTEADESLQQQMQQAQNKGQETFLMGCNCGLEWTVTGVSMKKDSSDSGPGAIKIEQYGSADGKAAGYNVSSSQQQDYKG